MEPLNIFHQRDNFCDFLLVSCTKIPSEKGVYSKKKEFTLLVGKFSLFAVQSWAKFHLETGTLWSEVRHANYCLGHLGTSGLLTSTYNMFFWRNKKNINTSWMKVVYLEMKYHKTVSRDTWLIKPTRFSLHTDGWNTFSHYLTSITRGGLEIWTYLEIWCEICHACSKPAIWKGAHWCGCCPCTCTLIKNPIMMIHDIRGQNRMVDRNLK